jgi:hypothetical protein
VREGGTRGGEAVRQSLGQRGGGFEGGARLGAGGHRFPDMRGEHHVGLRREPFAHQRAPRPPGLAA